MTPDAPSPFRPTPAEAAALQQLQRHFGRAWRSALILNVWLAPDRGASYFDPVTCDVLHALRHKTAFHLNAYDPGATDAASPPPGLHTAP